MKISQTKLTVLFAILVLGAAGGWSLTRVWPTEFSVSLPVPPMTALSLWVVTGALTVWAAMAKKRITGEPVNRLHPIVAARTAALAMASSRAGAIIGGFYLGVVLASVNEWNAESGQERVLIGSANIVAALVITLTGLWLERACRLPEPPASAESAD